MKRLAVTLLLSAFSTAVVAAPSPQKTSDARLAAGLLGTWQIPETRKSRKIVGEATYTRDGIVAGFVLGRVKFSDGCKIETRIKVKARWRIDQGIMDVDRFQTDPRGVMPADHKERYQIVSLTEDEVLFKSLGDGSELFRRRKKSR
jgi:hypothetical protein